MPLPDAGADGPLDWAHLVDAAKAFEGWCMCPFSCVCKGGPDLLFGPLQIFQNRKFNPLKTVGALYNNEIYLIEYNLDRVVLQEVGLISWQRL